MYIKVQTRIKADANGKKRYFSYPRLYESYRDSNGRIRQRYLLPLNLDDMPSFKDRNAMCGILNDMVGNGLAINFEDTAAYHKAVEIYHQLASSADSVCFRLNSLYLMMMAFKRLAVSSSRAMSRLSVFTSAILASMSLRLTLMVSAPP